MIPCPHGSSFHWIADIWWIFLFALPGVRYFMAKLGYKIREFCCGHRELTNKNYKFKHCEHKHE